MGGVNCTSLSPSTSPMNRKEGKLGDISGTLVFQWLTGQSTLESAARKSLSRLPPEFRKLLRDMTTCLSSLLQSTNTIGLTLLPKNILKGCRTGSSKYCRLYVTYISWMAKCPLARYLIIENCTPENFSTPKTAQELKELHDKALQETLNSLRQYLEGRFKIIYESSNKDIFEATIITEEKRFCISGKPDLYYILSYKNKFFTLIGDITLNDTTSHLDKEIEAYMILSYLETSLPTFGLLVYNRGIKLYKLTPKTATKLVTFFQRKISLEKTIQQAQAKFKKKPWICNLCDLQNICPLRSTE